MFRTSTIKNHHNKMMMQMQALHLPNATGGVCFGYAMMAAQAILLRDTLSIDHRMAVFSELPPAEVTAMLQSAFVRRQTGNNYHAATKEQFYLDMQAFLSGVALYQNLRPFADLFGSTFMPLKQDAARAAEIICPQKLLDRGGLKAAESFYGVYDDSELLPVLTSLRNTLNQNKSDFPIAFVLMSSNHALTLGFDPRYSKWLYMEVHDGATRYLDDAQAAEVINQAFSGTEVTAMTATAYTAGNHAEEAKRILSKWKNTQAYKNAHSLSLAHIKLTDSHNTSLLYMAVVNNDIKRVTSLLKSSHVILNLCTSSGLSPLHYAIISGYTECARVLLQHADTDVNLPAALDHYTPLRIAVGQQNIEMSRLLLQQKKIDINAVSEGGVTPLMVAASAGCCEILTDLLRMPEIQVNAQNEKGHTALHYAVEQDQIDCVERLIDHPELNIDLMNEKKATALLTAAAMNRLDIAKVILMKFPKVASLPVEGLMPIDVARYNRHRAMVDLLRWFTPSQPSAAPRP